MNTPPLDKVRWWYAGGYPSAGGFNAVLRATRAHRSALQADGIVSPDGVYTRRSPMMRMAPLIGTITASTLISGHQARWVYTIQPEAIKSDGTLEADGDPLTDCYNLAEFWHEAEPALSVPWYVWGVNAHQDGVRLTPLPVGGGASSGAHTQDRTVDYWEYPLHDNAGVYLLFDRIGGFYSECA